MFFLVITGVLAFFVELKMVPCWPKRPTIQ